MTGLKLFDDGHHRNFVLEEYGFGQMVQANQHLIVHGGSGMILDPGGHKVFNRALAETLGLLGGGKLDTIFLSHQDPDIVAAVNGWLMTTDATAYASELWLRFIPHFGLDSLVIDRLKGIPDQGMVLPLGDCRMLVLPAHFLHSEGNFQLYDPISKILYSGDLGAALGAEYREVTDFASHVQYMEAFHRRYMVSGRVLKAWAAMVRNLDIETIAPQHGAMFRGRDLVRQFIDWCETLECGIDLMLDQYQIPAA